MTASEHRKPEEELMVALRSIRPRERRQLKDQCLLGVYMWGEIVFGTSNLCGWFYKSCTRAATTVLKICLGRCGANSLTVSGFYFLGDLFTILSASEDSRSFMGGD